MSPASPGELPTAPTLARRTFAVTRDFWGLRVSRANAQPDPHEADVVWRLDMMEKLGSRQHNNSTCCVTVWKETLFVCTGNGVDESHIKIPAPEAPSFAALDKIDGQSLVDEQSARPEHSPRQLVLAGGGNARRRAAGDLQRRRRVDL